jgi:hypothetical protein
MARGEVKGRFRAVFQEMFLAGFERKERVEVYVE